MGKFVSKIDIALVQLRTAIQLYNKGNFICSLTLAGAAEEVLGQIAKKHAGQNALIDQKVWADQVADSFKKARPSLSKVSVFRNKVKNEVKHNNSGYDSVEEYDFKFEAEEFILALIRNYELINGHMPNDRIVKAFWKWMSM
ncbi:MAG TPA: hypothetical protein DIW54_06040 [Chitinophagaceae bacterium]|nr:hypothetical protein [Chitinophagaceae bacterium]